VNAETSESGGEFEVLTSPGPGGIAVLRVWGPRAAAFVERHVRLCRASSTARWQTGDIWRAALVDAAGEPLDDILVSVHGAAPALDVRLHLHGNPWLARRCTELLHDCGLVASAETCTSLWPTADVLEAEAWALLPRMLTLRGAHWLLDQIGQLRTAITGLLVTTDFEAARQDCSAIAARLAIVDWFARPARIVLAGPPNTGKSTLANALADRSVSIVSPLPGTTRDWVEVPGEAAGFPAVWLDTAGLRESAAALERAGIERTHELIGAADAVVIVLDVTEPARPTQTRFVDAYRDLAAAAVLLNKVDLAEPTALPPDRLPPAWRDRTVPVSAIQRRGLEALCETVLTSLGRSASQLTAPAAFTARQAGLLSEAGSSSQPGAMRVKLLQVIGSK
jgi:small GTP-binding protein